MNRQRLLLLLYPPNWRARYGDEFLALLEARPLRLRDILDVALNALDAHINPNLTVADTPLTERMRHLMAKLRSFEITIFAAWIAFVVAGLHLNGLMDDSPYMALTGLGPGTGIIDLTKPMSIAWDALAGGSVVALLAVLVGGVPLAYAAWRRAPQTRRLFVVPVIAFAAVVIVPIIALVIGAATHPDAKPLTNEGFRLGYDVLFVAAAAASTGAVARAIARADLPERLVRFAYGPGIITTLAMGLMLGGALAWGIFAHTQLPGTFDSGDLFANHITLANWTVDVLVMLIATVIAASAAIRGMGTRNHDTTPLVQPA